MERHVEQAARKRAIQRATNAEEELPEEYEIYKKYLDPIPPVETSVTTGPGLIKLINDMKPHDVGSNLIYTGEFGDFLTYSQDIIENITILAELYDLGVKEVTYTKGKEFRSEAIQGQSLSALLMGSPVMLYDENVKYRFQTAFMSKLARRSFFCYVPDPIPNPDFMHHDNPLEAQKEFDKHLKQESAQARAAMREGVLSITKHQLLNYGTPLTVSSEVEDLYTIYQRYNSDYVEQCMNRESTSALIRRHLQWKALKLAGAFAVLDMSDTIELEHFVAATQFCELLSGDMDLFEHDLNKSYYERFSDYCHTLVRNEAKVVVDVHDIKKRGFLSNVSKAKLLELVNLCASYDKQSIYSVIGDGAGIQFEPIVKTDVLDISYKPIDTRKLNEAVATGNPDLIAKAKHDISITTAYGYDLGSTTFADLADLLSGDFAYSPFKFRNGVRGKDNIVGGTKWLVLDVDDSVVTASEMHFMLMDINHHVALSSDPNNDYKFRVLIELDSVVELTPIAWKHFYLAIADDLAIKADPLPQSQIFFSYSDRPVLSNLDAQPLEVRDYIMLANEKAVSKSEPTKITNSAKQALLDNPLSTFAYAYECENGAGSRNVIRAMMHAKDLGANLDYCLELFDNIQSYWISPFPMDRQAAFVQQITRMF